MKSKSIITLLFITLISGSIKSQSTEWHTKEEPTEQPTEKIKKNEDYILKLNGDTLMCTVVKFNETKVKYLVNGEMKKSRPKKILGFKAKEVKIASGRGRVVIIGWKRWAFYREIISGKINMYMISRTDHFTGNSGSYYSVQGVTYYIRHSNNPRGSFLRLTLLIHRNILRVGNDCPEFIKKENETRPSRLSEIIDNVNFYNTNCH